MVMQQRDAGAAFDLDRNAIDDQVVARRRGTLWQDHIVTVLDQFRHDQLLGAVTPQRNSGTLTAGERVGPMPFLEHAIRMLKPGGRCAIVMPDNILFGDGTGTALRRFLMVNCNLHTILRLPTGIFYAQGVKTNVLFFTRVTKKIYPADHATQATEAVWFYDLRSNMPSFGKTNALTAAHFEEFEALFGPDPLGGSTREEGGESGRWRKLTREQIAARGDNLDWTWLRDESGDPEDEMTEPDEIAAAIMGHLRTALEEIEGLTEELDATPIMEAAE